jgi:hypothetical protein
MTDCVAVNYIESTKACWFHVNLDDLQNLELEDGTDIYIIKRDTCDNSKC